MAGDVFRITRPCMGYSLDMRKELLLLSGISFVFHPNPEDFVETVRNIRMQGTNGQSGRLFCGEAYYVISLLSHVTRGGVDGQASGLVVVPFRELKDNYHN